MSFELLVAIRYLKAKRKHAAISVITLVSTIGVAAGVAALVIALSINEGFREDLRDKLLGTTQPHVTLISAEKDKRIEEYRSIVAVVEAVGGVVAASPALYDTVLVTSQFGRRGVTLKGVVAEQEAKISDLKKDVEQGQGKGSLQGFDSPPPEGRKPPIVLGRELAQSLGVKVGDPIQVLSAETESSVVGPVLRPMMFEVSAIFDSGFFEHDSAWVYIPLAEAQRLLKQEGAVVAIEVRLRDMYQAESLGKQIATAVQAGAGRNLYSTNWIENNAKIFNALKLERIVMFITIGLIVMVAALNIVGSLTMMVLEKTRDIAILMAMGATAQSIRRVFVWQGVVIGVVGTSLGLIIGNVVSLVADHFHLVGVDKAVYSIDYVPFRTSVSDSVIIAVAAMIISFFATLYPSAVAARLEPVETLRYE